MAMKQIRGFRIRIKFVKAIKSAIQVTQKDSSSGYCKLKSTNSSHSDKAMIITKLCKFGRKLKTSVKQLWVRKSGLNYDRIGDKTLVVPRGHLAVYFGEEEDRVLVPVVYFNHPFFSGLLREAEKVYGFNHPGGIHVPCRISEFENLQTRISAAGGHGGYGL